MTGDTGATGAMGSKGVRGPRGIPDLIFNQTALKYEINNQVFNISYFFSFSWYLRRQFSTSVYFSGDKGGIGEKGSEHKGMAGMKGAPGLVGPKGERGHKGKKDLHFHNGTKQLRKRFIQSISCASQTLLVARRQQRRQNDNSAMARHRTNRDLQNI